MARIEIDKLGSQGDGMGMLDGRPVFVAFTLPGETVIASGEPPRLTLKDIAKASPHRVAPLCRHFGTCGGCALQHLAHEQQLEWKRAEVALAFSRAGLSVAVDPCIASPHPSRRRVTFSAARKPGGVALGFNQRGSHELVDIEHCPILLPAIESHLPQFAKLAASLLRGAEEIQIAVTLADNGLDLNFLLDTEPGEEMTAAFVRAFAKTGFLRAGINGQVIVEREKPLVSFDAATVAVPCGGFLQAVQEAEAAMADLVTRHLAKRKKLADLFSGSGTFALRLAQRSKVHAVESDANALQALSQATGTEGFKSVTTEVRDLDALPLTVKELAAYDGICLDPPRAGAAAQVKEIAKADLRSLAYVSCNPTTLAQDAVTLVKSGYVLERVVPIDQFVFSPHVEVVALFSKPPQKSKRSIFR